MRIMMIVASVGSYWINDAIAKARYRDADKMNFEAPLTSLVWITSIVSVVDHVRRVVPPDPRARRRDALVEARRRSSRAARSPAPSFPELVKVFTSTESRHVREVVTASREGGASLNVLAGLTAGNFCGLLDGPRDRRRSCRSAT